MTIELFEFVYWKKVVDPQTEECHRTTDRFLVYKIKKKKQALFAISHKTILICKKKSIN